MKQAYDVIKKDHKKLLNEHAKVSDAHKLLYLDHNQIENSYD